MTVTIAVLGASFAGLTTAHQLLKYAYPKHKDLKVIIVSKTTHWLYSIGMVRGIIPDEIPDSGLFYEIAPNLSKYPAESYELVIGSAHKLDTESNSVEVLTSSGSRVIKYDFVVLATGSSYASGLPFKTIDSYEKTKEAVHVLQDKVGKAKSIILGGGGAVGTEMVADLAAKYGNTKKLSWVLGHKHALPGVRADVGAHVESKVKAMGVEVIPDERVESVSEAGGQTVITLTSGKTLTTDLYLPVTGLVPNSSYVPAALLDENGYVKVNDHLRSVDVPNVYAVGDISNREDNYASNLMFQWKYIYPELEARLEGKYGCAKAYSGPPIHVTLFTLGPKDGTGVFGWFKAPSFFVTKMKSKTLLVEGVPGYIGGIKWASGAI